MFKIQRLLAALTIAASLLLPSLGHAEAPMAGRTHAVLVGIADYPSSPLARTDVDAERIGRALVRNVPAEKLRMHLLLNADATRANVIQALATVQREATEGDNVVFFFSGHGSPVADQSSDEGDQLDEVLSLYDGDLSDDELATALDGTKSRLTLVGIDACFSGGFLFDVGARAGRMTLLSSDEDLTSAVPAQEAGGHLSLLLAQALEGRADGAANGVFGQSSDGMLTALEIEVFIRREAARLPSIEASDPAGRNVGFQFIDIKRTGVRPDMVVMQVGEGTGEFVAPQATVVGTEVASFLGQQLSPSGNTHPIELTAGMRYRIETNALGGAADTVLALVHNGQVVAENDDVSRGDLSSRVEFTAPTTGRYEVRVRPYAESTLGSYGLRVAQLDAAPTQTDTPATATELVFERQGLQLTAAGDTQSLELAPGHYILETRALTGQADTVVRVLRDSVVVGENDDVSPDDLASRVEFDVPTAGTYAIEVRPYAAETLGTYTLAARRQPLTNAQPSTGGTHVLALTGLALGTGGAEHEVQVEAGRRYLLETRVSGHTDTVMTLRQGDRVVAQNDDAAPDDLSSRIEFTAPTSGTYVIAIQPYAPATTGNYDLTVTAR